MAPFADPCCSLKYLLKYGYHIMLTILLESSSKGMLSPIIVIFTLGHFATALFIILNWVCIDLVDISGPLVKMSNVWGFVNPESYHH